MRAASWGLGAAMPAWQAPYTRMACLSYTLASTCLQLGVRDLRGLSQIPAPQL